MSSTYDCISFQRTRTTTDCGNGWTLQDAVGTIPHEGAKHNMQRLEELLSQIQQINLSEKHKQNLLELVDIRKALEESAIVAITDVRGVITYANDKFTQISKYSREELIGNTHRIVNSGYHPPEFFKEMWDTIRAGKVWRGEIQNKAKDGTLYWVSTTIVPFMNEEGKPYQYIAIRTDITSRIRMEKELQRALENDFQHTIRQLANLIFKIRRDESGKYRFVLAEGKLADRLSFTTDRVRDKEIRELFPQPVADKLQRKVEEAYSGRHVHLELHVWGTDFLIHLSPILKDHKVCEAVGTAIDISQRKRAEEKIKYMAYHDLLTSLPNRVQFVQRLESRIEQAKKQGGSFAVMYIDLDGFKRINDTMGHMVGDELLKAVGRRLVESVRKKDVAARIGGDEFALLLPHMNAADAAACAQRLIKEMGQKYMIHGREMYVTPSIGISMYPDDGHTYEELLQHADAAMYHAKGEGKNQFRFFEPAMIESMKKKLLLESALRKALEENQLRLHYQPQVDIKRNKLIGVEALVRWYHPETGMVPPSDFIPTAEESGLIIPLGEWVLREACRQIKHWHRAGYEPFPVAVNISIRQFMAEGFPNLVQEILAETGLDPHFLELEITESLASDFRAAKEILYELKRIGVKVSIDDFGSGYSSLRYLSELPINKLKIDRVFIQELNLKNQSVIKAMIALAKNLELEVIAEGVETDSQVEFLKAQHCYLVQGYRFFKPMEAAQMEELLQEA